MATPTFASINVGDTVPPLKKGPIQRIQLVRYAGASGDFNPIHVDEPYAKSAGFPSVFAHGMLSMGFVAQCVTDWLGAGCVKKLGVRFAAITWPEDVITCTGTVTAKREENGERLIDVDLWAENQKGEKTVKGYATAVVSS